MKFVKLVLIWDVKVAVYLIWETYVRIENCCYQLSLTGIRRPRALVWLYECIGGYIPTYITVYSHGPQLFRFYQESYLFALDTTVHSVYAGCVHVGKFIVSHSPTQHLKYIVWYV